MSGTVREWKAEDLPQILELLKQLAARLEYDFVFDIERLGSQFREISAKPEEYASYVYEENGSIRGFVSAVFYVSVFHYRGTALVNELVVREGLKGRGIGTALIARIDEEARKRGMDELEVGVAKENAEAREFYRKNGIGEEYLLMGKEYF